ncbi:uncharacterized protein LOC124291187 [Haliotis rubra]|uniref:uncharacterized protein LOC124291187 n=1 Tax=Haliotis rubra TaxID=36100 RepID=UPI001EE5DC34|nr:uncharacterized protein LOC124291187 [Haliotis rubra]
MYQRNSSGPRFPKRESRAHTSTRDQFYNWISSHRSLSDPNCQENPRYSNLVRAYTTLGASDTENGFSNAGKSQKGVSPLNRAPDGALAKVISHKEEPIWSPAPARDAVAKTTVNDVKRNIQPSTSGNKTELRIEQAARIALPSSPSDEDIFGKTRVITPEQVSGKTRVITPEQVSTKARVITPEQVSTKTRVISPEQVSTKTRVITPEQVSAKTRVITPEQVSVKKQPSNTAATMVKPSCSQPSGESASSDYEARRQMAIKMILELRSQEMPDSGDESWSDCDSSSWETDTDSCSATSITDTVNAPTYPDEDSRLTAILRARLAAGHILQARKSMNSVSLDEKLHAIRYKPQPRAFAPWFDEDMIDYDTNIIGLLRPPAQPTAPYVGDVIATLVPPMSKLSLKHALNAGSHGGGDDELVTQAKGRKRQHDDVQDVKGIKRSRTNTSGTNEPIRAVTCGKRKAVEFADTLHAAKRMRN